MSDTKKVILKLSSELIDLEEKLQRLKSFIDERHDEMKKIADPVSAEDFEKLSKEEKHKFMSQEVNGVSIRHIGLLIKQAECMRNYQRVLVKRIEDLADKTDGIHVIKVNG